MMMSSAYPEVAEGGGRTQDEVKGTGFRLGLCTS
jgi:hypothetical protein